ncbi:MAG TPA: hypothetical protein VEQ63_11830 [Bryobacteraceae bacterium]|nr:hypothetical protein [Bryobacteraceae bacterium]
MQMPRLLPLAVAAVLLGGLPAASADLGAEAQYVGGTVAGLDSNPSGRILTTDDLFLEFRLKNRQVHVSYDKINLIEYGQNVDRRLMMAALVSPLFILSKKRQHFLTVGYNDGSGKQQAIVLKIDKKKIRAVLVALEARTGLRVQFQDNEARKAGKG